MIGTVCSDEKAALARAHGCARDHRLHARELRGAREGAHRRAGRAGRLRLDRQGHLPRVARLPAAARAVRELRQRVGAGRRVQHRAARAEGLAVRDAADAVHLRGEARRPARDGRATCSAMVRQGRGEGRRAPDASRSRTRRSRTARSSRARRRAPRCSCPDRSAGAARGGVDEIARGVGELRGEHADRALAARDERVRGRAVQAHAQRERERRRRSAARAARRRIRPARRRIPRRRARDCRWC